VSGRCAAASLASAGLAGATALAWGGALHLLSGKAYGVLVVATAGAAGLATASVLWTQHWVLAGLAAAVTAGCIPWYRRQLARAEALTATVGACTAFLRRHPGCTLVAAAAALAQLAWLGAMLRLSWSAAAALGASSLAARVVLPALALAAAWVHQTARTAAHLAVAGVFVRWYRAEAGEGCGDLRQAASTRLGPAAAAGAVSAGVAGLRLWLATGRAGPLRGWCLLPACAAALEARLNVYALAGVAWYGCPYFEAARRAHAAVRPDEPAPVVADALLESGTAALCGALALACALAPAATGLLAGASATERVGCTALAGVTGYMVLSAACGALWVAAVALRVCFSEAPEAMRRAHPEEFYALLQVWQREFAVQLVDDAVAGEGAGKG
jgi:hypothetical protein